MPVQIGHATGIAVKKIGGVSHQVFPRSWYLHPKGWILLRCRDADRRERIAEAMEKACANPMIGYDHSRRSNLYHNVKNLGFDPSKVTERVWTDCSGLVRVCIAYAFGEDRTGNFVTKNEADRLVGTGLFEMIKDEQRCTASDYLLRGDILCTPGRGHTVVVLESGPKIATTRTAAEPARCYAPGIAGIYVTTAGLNIRSGAGIRANLYGRDKKVLTRVPKGTKLMCCGSYTTVAGRRWLYVHFVRDGVTYTGFASCRYLKRN